MYDFEIVCALRFNWTQQQVDALDPDYAEELRAALKAEAEIAADRAEAQRRRNGLGGFPEGEDVPLDEIE